MKFLKRKKNGNGQMGLTILGSISAFSLWSAINPSFFTIREFSSKKSEHNVRFGMKLGLALCVALGAGLYLGYGSKGKWPAILTGATGVGLYAAYEYTLGQSHKNNPTGKSIAYQGQGGPQGGGGGGGGGGNNPYASVQGVMCADQLIGAPPDPMCSGQGFVEYDKESFCGFCFGPDGKPVNEECARVCGGGTPTNQTSAQSFRTIAGGV